MDRAVELENNLLDGRLSLAEGRRWRGGDDAMIAGAYRPSSEFEYAVSHDG